MNRLKAGVRKGIMVIIIALVAIWLKDFIHCETLTNRYGSEMTEAVQKQNAIISEVSKVKVLDMVDGHYAKVYCVFEDSETGRKLFGLMMYFKRNNNVDIQSKWDLFLWDSVWTNMGGNADGILWPYFR